MVVTLMKLLKDFESFVIVIESFLKKYEENLQEKMKGSDFEFDGVNFFIMISIK